jgi:hypothetical protein
MGTLLQILLFGIVGFVSLSLVIALLLRRSLRRMLRVHPKQRSKAPTYWVLGHNRVTRAHRRLRQAAHAAVGVSATHGGSGRRTTYTNDFPALGEAIAQHALTIETALVLASRVPKAQRNTALEAPIHEVSRIETAVAELIAASTEWQTTIDARTPHNPLDEIHERLTSLRVATSGVQSADSNPNTPLSKPAPSPIADRVPPPLMQDADVVLIETE